MRDNGECMHGDEHIGKDKGRHGHDGGVAFEELLRHLVSKEYC